MRIILRIALFLGETLSIIYQSLAVSPVALCSHREVVRLTGRESDTPSSNPAHCSFLFVCLFVFFLLPCLTLAIYWPGRTYAQPDWRLGGLIAWSGCICYKNNYSNP